MDIVPALLKAKADFKATEDVNAFNAAVSAAAAPLATIPDSEKAKLYDKMLEMTLDNLTRNEEVFDPGILYENSDNAHYLYEEMVKRIYGPDFFDFVNDLFEGG